MALDIDTEPGDIYQSKEGALYRVVGVQPSPTVIIEQITEIDGSYITYRRQGKQHTHAIGCLNAKNFTKIGAFERVRKFCDD